MPKKTGSDNVRKVAGRVREYLKEQRFLDPDETYVKSVVKVAAVKRKAVKPAAGKNTPVKTCVSKAKKLEDLRKQVEKCRGCPLGTKRLNAVFGEGSPDAPVMFVGEGPGFQEDHLGRPFIGKAGQLLTKIIEAMKFRREDVYIANIVKCHPMINPDNPEKKGNDRPPSKDEVRACLPYLLKQIEIIDPEIICTLGNPAVRTLLDTTDSITRLRGRMKDFRGRKLIPTFHPAALLRNPGLKPDTWKDMKLLMANLKKKPGK